MITFRKTLMATTMLVGLAIFATDAAQAGPNGGPSLGSISGFSSMRMDFNRVGGPNRALSRADMRVVPLEIKKSDKGARKDDKKSAAKKGADIARVSNPKSKSGGKGKESLADRSGPRIPAPLAELYRVTGGNLDDISKLAELASWLKTGLPVAGNPAFPQPGDGTFVPLTLGGGGPNGGEQSDRNFLDGWAGYSSAPHPFGNPHGKASNGQTTRYPDGSSIVLTVFPNGRDYSVTEYGPLRLGGENTGTVAREETRTTVRDGRTTREPTRTVHYDIDDPAVNGGFKDGPANYAEPSERTRGPRNSTGGENQDEIRRVDEETSGGENPPDSQPTEEGTGRPGRSGWCSPTGGCVTTSVIKGPQVIPASDASTPEMHSQLPSWATDPCPDCTSRGGGSGYSGYNPQNEGSGDVDGEGGRRTPM